LEDRQVNDQCGERSATELVTDPVVVGIAPIAARPEQLGSAVREELVALDADVELERLAREVRDRRPCAFPAERLHDHILIDTLDSRRVDLAFGARAQHAEIDALRVQADLLRGSGARGGTPEVRTLPLELARHPAR